MAKYRPNVALLLVDDDGRLLVCERAKTANSWQFPQGGVDKGESLEEALHREVEEEIGLPKGCYEVLESRDGYRYDFPPKLKSRKRYAGQEQTYFLCRLHPSAPPIDVHGKPREFQSHQWIKPGEFSLEWLPKFKRGVYREVLRDFFGVKV
ncbi:MAG: RNA pyrophosphohydrolase [Akkermansiaceae bacterium]|nr:RNA pyrophosphohydrolase [Akkermansiaceae bacterium]NNM30489.1 RNA pyrophosphohydrolase [Akkermansiaceae bacterium]